MPAIAVRAFHTIVGRSIQTLDSTTSAKLMT
jgi:hypothetical protein